MEYILHLELMEQDVVPSEKLAEMLREASLDLSAISLDEALEFYAKEGNLNGRSCQ